MIGLRAFVAPVRDVFRLSLALAALSGASSALGAVEVHKTTLDAAPYTLTTMSVPFVPNRGQ